MKKNNLCYLIVFCFAFCFSSFSQNTPTFSREMLKEDDKTLSFQDKTFLLHYFAILDFKEAKEAFFKGNFPPGAFKTNIHKLLDHSRKDHLKLDYSVSGYGATDFKYYESLPLTSVLKLAKKWYGDLEELEEMQMENSHNIDKTIKVSLVPAYLRVENNQVSFNFTVYNMSNKEIKAAYGNLVLLDNFGEVLISAQFPLEGGPYKAMSLREFKNVLEQKNWTNSMVGVSKEVNEYTAKRIKEAGDANLLLKYEPYRIIYSDGTDFIR